jgi:hypothetical protein
VPPGGARVHRYVVEQEVEPAAVDAVLALLDDPGAPVERSGRAALEAAVRRGLLALDARRDGPVPAFDGWIRALSRVLDLHVSGVEVVEPGRGADAGPTVARRHLARRGELVTVDLTWSTDLASGSARPGPEDLDALRERWGALPRWARDAFQLKFPELRRAP